MTPGSRDAVRAARILAALSCAAVVASACDGGSMAPDGPSETPELVFEPAVLELAEGRQAGVRLENRGDGAAGPIQLVPGSVTTETGEAAAGIQLQVEPAEIASLAPGATADITLSVELATSPAPGDYRGSLRALSDGDSLSALGVRFSIAPQPPGSGPSVSIIGSSAPRQGDVVAYTAEVRDSMCRNICVNRDILAAWREEFRDGDDEPRGTESVTLRAIDRECRAAACNGELQQLRIASDFVQRRLPDTRNILLLRGTRLLHPLGHLRAARIANHARCIAGHQRPGRHHDPIAD